MFRKREKQGLPMISIMDIGQGILYEGPMEGMALPDGLIAVLSDEFFGDPEPCFIHRTAVMQRVFAELSQALRDDKGICRIETLAVPLQRYLAAYPGCAHIAVREGGANA